MNPYRNILYLTIIDKYVFVKEQRQLPQLPVYSDPYNTLTEATSARNLYEKERKNNGRS